MSRPTNLAERLKVAIESQMPERGMFRKLAEQSGIAETNWKNYWYGRQKPNNEMIEWTCSEWPQFALWITTGTTFPQVGQVRPISDLFRGLMHQQGWTTKLMRSKIALQRYVTDHNLDEDRIDPTTIPQRLTDSIASASTLANDEIRRFLDNADLVWDVSPYRPANVDVD